MQRVLHAPTAHPGVTKKIRNKIFRKTAKQRYCTPKPTQSLIIVGSIEQIS